MANDVLLQSDIDTYLDSIKKIASRIRDIYEEHKGSEDYMDKIVDQINDMIDIPYVPESVEGKAIEYLITILIDIFEGNSDIDVDELLGKL